MYVLFKEREWRESRPWAGSYIHTCLLFVGWKKLRNFIFLKIITNYFLTQYVHVLFKEGEWRESRPWATRLIHYYDISHYKFVFVFVFMAHTCMYSSRKESEEKAAGGRPGSYIRPSTEASGRDALGVRILTNTNTPPQRQGQIQIHHCEDKDKNNKHIRLLLTSENYYILIVRPILIWLGGGN